MTARSYSPHGVTDPNPDYVMCCGLYHATTAAKVFAIYYFLVWLKLALVNCLYIESTVLTILSTILITMYLVTGYGTLFKKKECLVPFLIAHGLIAVPLLISTVYFAFLSFTDVIYDDHTRFEGMRRFYDMLDVDRDNKTVQTVTSAVMLFCLTIQTIVVFYSWVVMWKAYKCFREDERTIYPGYRRGVDISGISQRKTTCEEIV